MTAEKSPIPITVTIHVDAGAAVRSLHGHAGPHVLRLDAADLAALTPDQREALALHVEGRPSPSSTRPAWGDPLHYHAAPVGTADVPTLALLLTTRRAVMAAAARAEAERDEAERVEVGGKVAALLAAVEAWRTATIVELITTPQWRGQAPKARTVRDLFAAYIPERVAEAAGILPDAIVASLVGREAEADAEIARQIAERDAAEAARKAECDAQAERDAALVAALVEAHDPSALPRLRAGVLPAEEIAAALRRTLRPITRAVALDSADADSRAIWTVPDTYTAAEWDALARAREAAAALVLPDGTPAKCTITLKRSVEHWDRDPDHEDADHDGDVRVGNAAVFRVVVAATIAGRDVSVCRTLPADAPMAASPSDPERAAVQRRIADAVRDASPQAVGVIVRQICDAPPRLYAEILAASLDPVIADALRQVAQVRALE